MQSPPPNVPRPQAQTPGTKITQDSPRQHALDARFTNRSQTGESAVTPTTNSGLRGNNLHRSNTPQWWVRGRVRLTESPLLLVPHWRSSRPVIRCSCHRRSNTDAGRRIQFSVDVVGGYKVPNRGRGKPGHRVRRLVSGNVERRDSPRRSPRWSGSHRRDSPLRVWLPIRSCSPRKHFAR